ncbi:Alpha-(1,3)-fucosyltransferase C [Armadillidium vulgare]|nr:Alpha-(1,3)-fucosyltransferase C [Armadillidium vulgare]
MIILKRIRNFKLFKLLICCLLGVVFYFKFFIYYDGPSYDTERNVEEWKTILAWTDFFSSRDIWKKVFRRLTNRECEEYKCRLSLNQNDLPIADAILFNAFDMRSDDSPFKPFVNSYPLPTRVNEDQIFVFYSTEPPTAWKTGVIPVVLGSTNYSTFAPPNSFIDSSSFSSIEELAKHMKYVASNLQVYNSYLEWGEDYDIEMGCPYNCLSVNFAKRFMIPKRLKGMLTFTTGS